MQHYVNTGYLSSGCSQTLQQSEGQQSESPHSGMETCIPKQKTQIGPVQHIGHLVRNTLLRPKVGELQNANKQPQLHFGLVRCKCPSANTKMLTCARGRSGPGVKQAHPMNPCQFVGWQMAHGNIQTGLSWFADINHRCGIREAWQRTFLLGKPALLP